MQTTLVPDPFCKVDASAVPTREETILIDRLDGHYYPKVISWFFEHVLARISPASVLEVGCGTGHLLDYVCQKSGAKGSGVDLSAYLAERTAERFPQYDISSADGRSLPFENNSFDLVYIATVLVHADEPEQIVREMARVVRPGGMVALLDQDFETAVLYPASSPTLTRRVLNAASDFWQDGWIGRRLPSLLENAGLTITEVDATVRVDRTFDEGFFVRIRDWIVEKGFPPADADAWLDDLRVHGRGSDYLFSRNFYYAFGVK